MSTIASTVDRRQHVQQGDTFETLSNRFFGTQAYAGAWRTYIAKNDTYADMVVKGGQPIVGKDILLPTRADLDAIYKPAPAFESRPPVTPAFPPAAPTVPPTVPVSAAPTSPPPSAAQSPLYTVKNPGGERLYDIAQTVLGEGWKVGQIQALNPQFPPEDTKPVPYGTVLKMPPGTKVPPQNQN